MKSFEEIINEGIEGLEIVDSISVHLNSNQTLNDLHELSKRMLNRRISGDFYTIKGDVRQHLVIVSRVEFIIIDADQFAVMVSDEHGNRCQICPRSPIKIWSGRNKNENDPYGEEVED
jgi:propanediol dehydratase large subunit